MREFPQAEDFPPPPLSPYVALTVLACIMLGVLFLRTNRKVRFYDAFFWVATGCMLQYLFFTGGQKHLRIRPLLETGIAIVWTLMLVGCLIGWVRLIRQKEPRYFVLSLVLTAAAFMLLPAPPPAPRDSGGRFGACKNNVQQLGIALYNYRDHASEWPSQQAGNPPVSWRVSLMPYLDYTPQYKDYDLTATWDSEANRPLTNREMSVYRCPSSEMKHIEGQPFPTSYALLIGDNAAWKSSGLIEPDAIPDGASNTAILTEACGLGIIWTEPRDIDLAKTPIGINLPGNAPGHSPGAFSAYHQLGANVLMADGSVRTLWLDTDPEVMKAMLTADSGDEVGEF